MLYYMLSSFRLWPEVTAFFSWYAKVLVWYGNLGRGVSCCCKLLYMQLFPVVAALVEDPFLILEAGKLAHVVRGKVARIGIAA